ncbi:MULTISPECIES: hypothetical protein [Methanobacterium]|uniref:Uncharacterized protein n=1 Tax=Methanobacterium bryantii TaxID=2161 RepID=A0A2A2H3U6_METBR|nr:MULTISPECIES: hypothetical protein [Methanobacterium]OEC86682.1 hypothetical protein A9507_09515 [Methanobacterium sp. A39]PAV03960.1 hypothetical protein ASJ80_02790 [Methanobacterium bryantii]
MISTLTAMTTTITPPQIMDYSIIVIAALIIFLALKEIVGAESDKNKRMKSFVSGSNIVIVPLILVFLVMVAYRVITIS